MSKNPVTDDSSIVFLQVLAALGIAVPWMEKNL
jgi:hypothetical protein